MERPLAAPESGGIGRLTSGLATGNEEAFREFHARYFDRLYRFLLVVTRGQEDEAQEALQQTLLRVLRYARRFESEEVFWSWLQVLARSAARDAGRKRQRYLALLQNFAARWRVQAQPRASEEDRMQELLQEELDKLDALDRRLICGKYLEGSTVRELGFQTGLTEKAVESRLLRLRHQLREKFLSRLRTL